MEEIDLFDAHGNAVAYVAEDGITIYTWNGYAQAYLDGTLVYGWNGRHLGWFVEGILYDADGQQVGFIESTCRKTPFVEHAKSAKTTPNAKKTPDVQQVQPGLSTYISETTLADFLELGVS
jgi:hypothetical protein